MSCFISKCPILSHIILSYLAGTAALIIQYFKDPKYWKAYCNPDYFLCSSGKYIRALTVFLMGENTLSRAVDNTSESRGEMSSCNRTVVQDTETPECVFLCVCIFMRMHICSVLLLIWKREHRPFALPIPNHHIPTLPFIAP